MKKFLSLIKKWMLLIIAPIPLAVIVMIVDLIIGGQYFWLQGVVTLVIAWIPSVIILFIMTMTHNKKKKNCSCKPTENVQKAEESK